MKIQFKVQDYQTDAVAAVVDCFAGQPYQATFQYRIDPGSEEEGHVDKETGKRQKIYCGEDGLDGFRNEPKVLPPEQTLSNIQRIQLVNSIKQSRAQAGWHSQKVLLVSLHSWVALGSAPVPIRLVEPCRDFVHILKVALAQSHKPWQITDLIEKRSVGPMPAGELHELTFSCYRRLKLLTNDDWRRRFCSHLDQALSNQA